MNRKRKSADVLAQLGEPLPLPYRPSPAHTIKTEERDDESSETEQIITDTFRPRQVLLRFRDREIGSLRLPIWHNRAPSGDIRIEDTVLDSIEQKIAALRSEAENIPLGNELAKLEEINQQLEHLIEQRHENSLLQELEKLQQATPAAATTAATSSATATSEQRRAPVWLLILIALVPVFAGISGYIAGGYMYEYCYYFC